MTYQAREQRLSRHLVSFFVVLFVLCLGIGIGTLITHHAVAMGPGDSQLKIQSGGTSLASPGIQAMSQAFEEVAKRVGPAVVNINTEAVIAITTRPGGSGRNNQQTPDWFGQMFPNAPQQRTLNSLGSGILVDPKGYIITNNHVVADATKIKVNVKDGNEYQAHVIAGDELSDIAVIKIDGDKEFPYVKIGDSKAMKVGDWVIAIGSPFGLEQSVTAGIVSAIGRVFENVESDQQQMLFNDYLQTDAAINPGNSGGPLVNMNGEVIGINSFINTTNRANAGVGFAVPSHIFVEVYNQILEKGKVSRGYLGVLMNAEFPFTPAMAEYFGVKQGKGVLITGLGEENGPAGKAGIKPEDVIIEFEGKKITSVQELRLDAANTPPGRTVNVKAVRFGTVKDFSVTMADRKILDEQATQGITFEPKAEPKTEIGMSIDNVPARLAQSLNISGGALLLSVSPGSLAEDAGLVGQKNQAGAFDIVQAANGKKIEVAQDLLDILKGLKSGQAVILKILRVPMDASGRIAMDANGKPATSTGYTSIVMP